MGSQGSVPERIDLVVGLGNPGREYEGTRHNVGFQVVDRLAQELGIALQERKFRAAWGGCPIEGRKILLAKPMTYMNRSGEAIREIVDYFGLSPASILVAHDDLDLPLGRIRLARQGGAGGHRGILSLIQHLGQQGFARMKLGIGRPLHKEPIEAFVLQMPYAEDRSLFGEMIHLGAEAVCFTLRNGLGPAMNHYNRRDS